MKHSKAIAGGIATVLLGLFFTMKRDTSDTIPAPKPGEPDAQRAKVLAIARGEIGWRNESKYWEGYPPRPGNWCGAFTAWVLRHAGFGNPQPSWRWCLLLPETKDPKLGDLVFFGPPNNHEAVLVSLTDDSVTTIDGNQELDESRGGLVRQVTRPRSHVESFRSIEPLLSPVEPATA